MNQYDNPEEAIEAMDLYGPMVVADFGAGCGFFSIPAAEKISDQGVIYALDIQEQPLALLRKRAQEKHLSTIQTIRADLEKKGGSHLKDASVDRVIIANILFQAPDKKAVLHEAFRILKKSGKLIVVEWRNDLTGSLGPRHEGRIAKEALIDLLAASPASYEKEFTIGEHHYGIVYKKNS
jgi:ubiquinone/menaquinone biosynthesis C-methylase UbiE